MSIVMGQHPQSWMVSRKNLLNWMIWGYPYFSKPPDTMKYHEIPWYHHPKARCAHNIKINMYSFIGNNYIYSIPMHMGYTWAIHGFRFPLLALPKHTWISAHRSLRLHLQVISSASSSKYVYKWIVNGKNGLKWGRESRKSHKKSHGEMGR